MLIKACDSLFEDIQLRLLAYKEKLKFLKECKKEEDSFSNDKPLKRKSTNIEEGVESKTKKETYLNLMDFDGSPPKKPVTEDETDKNNPFANAVEGNFEANKDFNFDFN